MEFDEIYKKYLKLQKENEHLKNENTRLNDLFNLIHKKELHTKAIEKTQEENIEIPKMISSLETTGGNGVNNNSNPDDKINLFISLFKGRTDVYAKRWENSDGKGGYSPVCLNEWHKILCNKPKIKCSNCPNRVYGELNTDVINKHLRGEITAGVFPMLEDETCYFLAIDFDDGDGRRIF